MSKMRRKKSFSMKFYDALVYRRKKCIERQGDYIFAINALQEHIWPFFYVVLIIRLV